MNDDSDHGAVLLESVEGGLGHLRVGLEVFSVLVESLLLGLVPVSVEFSLEFISEVLGPESGESSESSDGLDVPYKTYHSDGRGLNHGYCFYYFFLVHGRLWSDDFSEHMGHTCFESWEGGEMRGLGLVILRERSYSSFVVTGSSLW